MKSEPNKLTGANAGGPARLPTWKALGRPQRSVLLFAEIHMPLRLSITDDAALKCLWQRLADDIIEYQYQFI